MALRWLVHSVCATAFGFSTSEDQHKLHHGQSVSYINGGQIDGSSKMLKDFNEGSFQQGESCRGKCSTTEFQMPLHYPRYKKSDYENMEEWRLDRLLSQYGLTYEGSLEEKRSYAMGAFLWPDQI